MSNSVGGWTGAIRQTSKQGTATADHATAIDAAGKGKKTAEVELADAIAAGDEPGVQKAQDKIQMYTRFMEAINQMIKASHEMMMSVIRNIGR